MVKFVGFDRRLKEVWGNDVEITLLNREIVHKKTVLKKLFTLYYQEIISFIKLDGPTVEIGSGAGFFNELFPQAISSDVLFFPGIDLVSDCLEMPFKNQSIKNIVLKGVLHHINNPFVFFRECERVLQADGRIIINDAYISPFSYFVFKFIHFENFSYSWQLGFKKGQPLMDCNTALATILFKRRLSDFKKTFSKFQIVHTNYHTFFIYLLTGGYSYPALIPDRLFNAFMYIEKVLKPLRKVLANNMFIVIEKI